MFDFFFIIFKITSSFIVTNSILEMVPAYNINSTFLFIFYAWTITGKFIHTLVFYLISLLFNIWPYFKFLERLELLKAAGNAEFVEFCYSAMIRIILDGAVIPIFILTFIYITTK